MFYYSFEDFWKRTGKYYDEVISSPRELEEKFKKLGEKIWLENRNSYKEGYKNGYDNAKNK